MARSFSGRHRSASKPHQRRRAFLSLESLEERAVLAGNVTATVTNGYLLLVGDSADNKFEVMRTTGNDVVITALDGTTTFNGAAGPLTLNNVRMGVNAQTGAGNDEISLTGSSTTVFRVLGQTKINSGDGNDIVRFTNYSMAGHLTVNTGEGADQFYADSDPDLNLVVNGLRVAGTTTITTAGEDDIVSIQDSLFVKNFTLNTGFENDRVDIRTSEFGKTTIIHGSTNTDRLNRFGNRFHRSPIVIGFEVKTNSASPVAANDTATVARGATATLNVLANDSASGNLNASTVTIVQQPTGGTATVNSNGTITYVNSGGSATTDTLTYTVRDSAGRISNVATVSINTTATNVIPVAVADAFTVAEGSTTSLNVAANDTDTENSLNLGSIVIVQQPTNGTLVVNANGTVSYMHNGSETTTDSFTYTIADSAGGVSLAGTVTLTITPVNDAPTIGAIGGVTINENTSTSPIAVTVGDAETAAASLTVTATSSNTTLVPNANIVVGGSGANRTLVITPAANQFGTSTITVTVNDGTTTSTQTFVLTVTDTNNTAPTIGAIADLSTNEDTPTSAIAVTVNDTETAAGSLTVTATSSDQALVPNANIVVGGSGSNRTLVITPAANATGNATITVTVSDGTATITETFVLTVTAVNDAPTVAAIADLSTVEDTATSPIAVTIGDAETAAGSLTVTATSSDQAVVPNANIVVGGSGANRTLVIAPASGATGTSTITVTVSDGTTTTMETFVLTVTAANDAPTIDAIADLSTAEDTATSAIAVTVGDAETPVGSLTVTATSSDQAIVPNANIVVGGSGANRTLVITPAANATGTATITVSVNDGTTTTTETFVLTVTAVNDAPTVAAIADLSTPQDTATSPIAVTISDAETATGSLTVTATSSDQAVVPNANIVVGGSDANRTLVITPAAGITGTSTITVTVNDGTTTTTETFVLTVTAPNDAPTIDAIADLSTAEDTATSAIAVTVGDTETPVGSLTVTATSSDQAVVPNANIVVGGSGANRTLVITPAANATGTATVTVSVNDGTTTTTEIFVLTVTAVNDAPTIDAIADLSTDEDTATGTIAVTIGDAETVATALTVTATSSDQAVVPDANIVVGGSGANRTLVISPAAGISGTSTITVTVNDGTTTTTETFVLTVTAVNDAPTIDAIADLSTDEDTATGTIAVTVNDVETAAADLTVTATSSDQTLIPDANIVVAGSGANRTLVITPAANLSGSATITVTVSDGTTTSTETFVLTVTAVNDAPTIATLVDVQVAVGATIDPISVTVGDVETAATALTVTATSDNQALILDGGLVVTGSGASRTLTITPVGAATGTANVTVTVDDGTGGITTEVFQVSINEAPTITAIADQNIGEDGATTALAFTIGDADSTPANLTVTSSSNNTTLVPNASIVIDGTGTSRTVTVTPAANLSGTATITITVTDETGLSTTETFDVIVAAQNDNPTMSTVSPVSVVEDAAIDPILVNISDLETPETMTLTGTSDNQALIADSGIVVTGTGGMRTVTLTQVPNASGTANITLTLSDGNGGTSMQTFAVTITAANDAPVAVDDQTNVDSDVVTAVMLNVLSNDTDVDTLPANLSVSAVTGGTVGTPFQGQYGTITLNADGSLSYTIDPAAVDELMTGEMVEENINYTISDGDLTDLGLAKVVITGV